jgi:hypothetical protein
MQQEGIVKAQYDIVDDFLNMNSTLASIDTRKSKNQLGRSNDIRNTSVLNSDYLSQTINTSQISQSTVPKVYRSGSPAQSRRSNSLGHKMTPKEAWSELSSTGNPRNQSSILDKSIENSFLKSGNSSQTTTSAVAR